MQREKARSGRREAHQHQHDGQAGLGDLRLIRRPLTWIPAGVSESGGTLVGGSERRIAVFWRETRGTAILGSAHVLKQGSVTGTVWL